MNQLTYTLLVAAVILGCHGSADEKRLYADLLIGYNSQTRPVLKSFEPVHLKLGVSLREAIDLNEDLGQVTLIFWLKMAWKDVYLRWDPQEYGGIEEIFVSAERIWNPDITMYNALRTESGDEHTHLKLMVQHDGLVTWVRPVTYTVTCRHEFRGNAWLCPLTFGSWAYNAKYIDIHSDSNPDGNKLRIDDEQFRSSDHFALLGHEGKRELMTDKCCGGPFTTLSFLIKLRNKIGAALLGKK